GFDRAWQEHLETRDCGSHIVEVALIENFLQFGRRAGYCVFFTTIVDGTRIEQALCPEEQTLRAIYLLRLAPFEVVLLREAGCFLDQPINLFGGEVRSRRNRNLLGASSRQITRRRADDSI